ncbi:hypothetical protein WN51_03264 [Melipona quadrifasciata]|uniref:Ig-like domain-containing protein n=1 Tax=Melipona quadrifasciata TaxID=166423 RepID=A0A0N1ITE5_9HYME|nr:hypothetical protein WN51_03264 [Melipona quadrifasciata]
MSQGIDTSLCMYRADQKKNFNRNKIIGIRWCISGKPSEKSCETGAVDDPLNFPNNSEYPLSGQAFIFCAFLDSIVEPNVTVSTEIREISICSVENSPDSTGRSCPFEIQDHTIQPHLSENVAALHLAISAKTLQRDLTVISITPETDFIKEAVHSTRLVETDTFQEWPTQQNSSPYIDTSVPSNVTGLVGKTIELLCKVKNLGNRTVSTFLIDPQTNCNVRSLEFDLSYLMMQLVIIYQVTPIAQVSPREGAAIPFYPHGISESIRAFGPVIVLAAGVHVSHTDESKNVKVFAERNGRKFEINCRTVKAIRCSQSCVSWVRHRDIHLLTIGRYTYTSDQRFEAMHTPHAEEWTLRIRYPQKKDSGIYECQISTTPPIGYSVQLNVVANAPFRIMDLNPKIEDMMKHMHMKGYT